MKTIQVTKCRNRPTRKYYTLHNNPNSLEAFHEQLQIENESPSQNLPMKIVQIGGMKEGRTEGLTTTF